MRKLSIILAILLALSIISLPFFDREENEGLYDSFRFVLPASLIAIEDQAFEGTVMKDAFLPATLTTIGERAFAGNLQLRRIIIPKSVSYIGDHAVEPVSGLTVYGEAGSFAAKWTREHNYTFVRLDGGLAWINIIKKLIEIIRYSILPLSFTAKEVSMWRRRWAIHPLRSMRPQDRIELYPINYRFP